MALTTSRRIWVTWENQRRNRTLSETLNATLFEVVIGGNRLRRYASCLAKTYAIFRTEKPSTIFAQNPSIVLATFSILYARLLGVRIIIDAHYAGIRPLQGKSVWANLLTRIIFRSAHLVIVTNDGDHRHVKKEGGRPFILPDPIPAFKPTLSLPLKGKRNVLFVCTWADDEPYHEVIRAASLLPPDTCVYITGNSKGKAEALKPLPGNVVLSGYVDESTYIAMLNSCDVIIDLTTRDHCLVCGGYEALATAKPLVLSRTHALRSYFADAAVYTDNSATDIAAKITEALHSRSQLRDAAQRLTVTRQKEWAEARIQFENLLLPLEQQAAVPTSD